MTAITLPRWIVLALASGLIAASAFSFGAIYSARSVSHDTTFYACLFAGSLSQVNTNDFPANCGRGTPVSWNVEGVQGPSGVSQAYFASEGEVVFIQFSQLGEQRTLINSQAVPAGEYVAFAAVDIINGVGAERFVECHLEGGSFDTPTLIRMGPLGEVGDSVNLALQNAYSFDDAGSIELRCGGGPGMGDSSLQALRSKITVIAVDQVAD